MLNLMSGSSISVSWTAVAGASSYTLSVEPAPEMKNELSVSTNYAFVDGLVVGQEYTIRVQALVNGVVSSFSEALKVTPSGAPIIAPAPRVVSYDETSVTLSRHHMHHYRNGNEFTTITVQIKEEGGETKEWEYPYNLPLKVTGLASGKTYTFAWRFANTKGKQETYSRASRAVTLQAPCTFYLSFYSLDEFSLLAAPVAPQYIHLVVEGSTLRTHWRPVESTGRPVLKYNVRVADLTGHVLFEKVAYKPFMTFRNVMTQNGLSVQVNVMTSAGLSEWSVPYVYNPTGKNGVNRSGNYDIMNE